MKLSAYSVAALTLAYAGGVFAAATQRTSNRVVPLLEKRAERCGYGIGRCSKGKCCSESGYCGATVKFCEGSQCQLEYSDSCDTFKAPPGASTEHIPRPQVGPVPYGSVIDTCDGPGMLALTYDDGPYTYTSQLLDILDNLDVKATFFIAGNNRAKGRIDDESTDWPRILRRMHSTGHQLASHTWTHRNLNQVNGSVQLTEMVYNEMAFRNIFGFFPTYMRPPYLECSPNSGCTDLMENLGYHIVTNNIDTKDYEDDDRDLIQRSKDRFSSSVSPDPSANEYIELSHDVHYQTVVNLTEYMVRISRDKGYRLVTVGECLGDPKRNWYRGASDDDNDNYNDDDDDDDDDDNRTWASTRTTGSMATSTTPYAKPSRTSIISKDQKCGGDRGFTCEGSKFGSCCSFYGYCGTGKQFCGTGCSPDFGTCMPVPGGIADTTNGLCGSAFSASCSNYGEKNCCSQYGFCGQGDSHCGKGCQKGYGKCD